MMAGDSGASLSASNADVVSDKVTVEAHLMPPIVRREVFAVVLWTLFADLLIFRTFGFSGPGLFLGLAPAVFFIGCPGLSQPDHMRRRDCSQRRTRPTCRASTED
jgi:hypothetical protein